MSFDSHAVSMNSNRITRSFHNTLGQHKVSMMSAKPNNTISKSSTANLGRAKVSLLSARADIVLRARFEEEGL